MPGLGTSITCSLSPAHDLYHLSNILTGLSELAERGSLSLHIEPVVNDARNPLESVAMRASVSRDGRAIEIVFDLYDRSDTFEMPLLEQCDLYFKRSFCAPNVPERFRSKVMPFGLNYSCYSAGGEARLRAAGMSDPSFLSRYVQERPWESFEQPPTAEVSAAILFQTRAWPPDSIDDDAVEINQSRVLLIRELRRAFPGRFHGGFAPSAYTRLHYPDLVSECPSDEGQYTQFAKRHLIGISTRGLRYSVPFKAAEYLAASIAMVSEPLRTRFPEPLLDGRHFLAFENPDECIAQCDRILSNLALARDLREAAWHYYEAEIRPARHMAKLLDVGLAVATRAGPLSL
jgi:hypothetical protein